MLEIEFDIIKKFVKLGLLITVFLLIFIMSALTSLLSLKTYKTLLLEIREFIKNNPSARLRAISLKIFKKFK